MTPNTASIPSTERVRRPRGPVLPLRRWLVLALASTFVVPVFITAALIAHLVTGPRPTIDVAAERLQADAARWADPAWQTATRADLAADGVDFVLIEDGRELYRSTAAPLAATAGDGSPRLAQRVVIPGSERVAYLYADQSGWGGGAGDGRPFWLVPIVGGFSLLFTLGAIGWFLGRTVVKPLAAARDAATEVAAGNLDIALPSSRVREVAELKAAFEAMSAGLQTSIQHQAEMEQQRRLFIGAIVHDLRTPLFTLRGYLEGLATGVADTPDKRMQYVETAREKAAALERLITDLFDYTRLEYLDQSFTPPSREPIDLGALLRRLVDGLQPQASAKRIDLVLDEPLTQCTVQGDAHLLSRAVENLLDNALRYTPSGGSVRVACHPAPNGIAFSVADSGPGIPARDMPHLFTPLFRGESSRNRRSGGAGLGLTIARRILLAHGGDLVAGKSPAGGAVFTATLPKAD